MNFIKNKTDVKRASYYVWFLGSKESKGLRGDEYVSPVLNFLLDSECEFEPSKVTLQVSNKGLKIIQILTVPRKSSKLNAEQQMQLFASSHRLKSDPPPSSVLKTEQVKHHIPHNSITWVYQEEDIICAILLLYNPITRCPVHVHAYRCDSVETASNLRQQLQTLVDRQENQKKFREIEARLAAKGLLLSPHSFAFPDEDLLAHGRSFNDSNRYNSRSSGKTLNSDGRSTRTEGSDENSEESNSSDLGYAVRSKSSHINNGFKHISPPMHQMSKSELRQNEHCKMKTKPSNKTKKLVDDVDILSDTTAALYDSVTAELRAKLGNPKMGPILLPPRDYDFSGANKARNESQERIAQCALKRSESSGKSSSGIGSDEALASENQKKLLPFSHHPYDSDRNGPKSLHDRQPKRYLFPNENGKQLYSLQMYSSDEENFDSTNLVEENAEDIEEDVLFTTSSNPKSKSTYDIPSYEKVRASHNNYPDQPSHPSKYLRQQQAPNTGASYDLERKLKNSNRAKMFSSNPNLSPEKEVKSSEKPPFVIGRREQRSLQSHYGVAPSRTSNSKNQSSTAVQKFYFADAEFTDPKSHISYSTKEVSKSRQLGRSSGNLASMEYNSSGPVSLNYHHVNERSISPYFYSSPDHQYEPKSKHYVPSKSQEVKNHHLAMKKKLEQPYSRYSYVDYHDSRFNYPSAMRR